MALRQWLASCTSPDTGLCGRLRDTVQEEDGTSFGGDNSNNAGLWKDLTMAVMESPRPTVPKEIHIRLEENVDLASSIHSSEIDSDTLLGLDILSDSDDDSHPKGSSNQGFPSVVAPFVSHTHLHWLSTECSWTYSTSSSHEKDLVEFMKFDDGSSYSSRGKPPLPQLKKKKSHKKTISSGTASTVLTSSRSSVCASL